MEKEKEDEEKDKDMPLIRQQLLTVIEIFMLYVMY